MSAEQPALVHDYKSTACFHGECGSCRVQCKFCPATCGHGCHDQGGQAAHRLGRLVSFEGAVVGLLATNPAALHDEIRRAAKKEIAAIHAEGPIGCDCGHCRCAESRPQVPTT